MALNFPTGPTSGAIHTYSGKTWRWNGYAWDIVSPSFVNTLNGCTGNLTITGTANQVTVTNSCPNIVVGLPSNLTVGNLTVTGSLLVSGGITTQISEVVLIEDNIIVLNANVTGGSPTENAGIQVSRGASAAVQLLWNETTDKWTFTNDGSQYYDLPVNVVNTVNGATGNIVSIATTGSNIFTGLQTMNAGLTTNHLYVTNGATFAARASFNSGLSAANLFVSGGSTFGGSISTTDPNNFNILGDQSTLMNVNGSRIQLGWTGSSSTTGGNIYISNDGENTVSIRGGGGVTINGGTAWHSLNDGKGSGLDADLLRGVNGDRLLEEIQSGLLYGGVITINAGNTGAVDVSAGAGIIVTVNGSTGAFPAPSLQTVTWTAKTGVAVTGLTSSDFTFFRIDSSGNLQQSTSNFTQTEYLNSVVIGNAVHQSRAYVNRVHYHPIVAYASSAQYETFIRYFGGLKVDGYVLSGYGTTGQIQHTTGTAFALGANMDVDPNNPSLVTDSSAVPVQQLFYLYRNAGGTYRTDPTSRTTVNFGNYDDGDGTLGTISNNNWSIQRVYKIPGLNNALYIYYGTASYSTDTVAANNILLETFAEADITRYNGVFLGWLIVRGGGSNASSTGDCRIVPGGFFRNTTGGGGASTVLNLDDLGDVAITSAANNQILRYDSTQGLWVNSAVTTLPLVTSINGITGAIGITAGSNITITQSGLTFTVSSSTPPLASATVTGVASFGNEFTVSAAGAVGLTSNYVKSVNGLTGAVVSIATTGSNVFTGLQTMNSGLTANNIYVTNGATFASTIQGTTASFTGLVSSTVGFSGSATNLVGNANGLTAGTASRVQIAEGAGTSYYLALAGGVGNTGIFVDTSAPRWLYNASTGALTTSTGYVEAANLYATSGIYSNGIAAYDGTSPLIINSPNFDNTSQAIHIGDYAGAGNGTLITIDDNLTKIELAATNIDAFGDLNVKNSGYLVFYDSDSSNYVAFRGATTIAANTTWILPSADGSANQVLTTNGSGTLSWSTPSGGGGSSVTSFNGLTGAVTGVSRVNGLTGGLTFAAGTGITFTTSGNTITIASAPKSTTQTLDFSENINGLEIVFYGTGNDFSTSLRNIEKLTSISAQVNGYTCSLVSIQSFYDSTNGWSARLIVKSPFAGNVSAETIYLAGVSSVSISGYSGGALIDDTWVSIASSKIYHQEETYVTKTVTGQSWVAADSYITCKVLGLTTSDHTPEDAILEGVQFEINNIVAGTGFDIIGHAPEGTYGKYTVKCIEQ